MEKRGPSKGGFNKMFDQFASLMSKWTGHSIAFTIAVALTVIWAVSGPAFNFSDTWQLVINTGTTVLTFLMVFVLQNTMNRDSKALHLKLNELIRVTTQAHDSLIGAEHRPQKELDEIDTEYRSVSKASRGR